MKIRNRKSASSFSTMTALAIFAIIASAFIISPAEAFDNSMGGCKHFNITTGSTQSLSIDHFSTVFDTNECMRVTVHQYAGDNVWNLICFGDFKGNGVGNHTAIPKSFCDTVTVPPETTMTFKLDYTVCNENCTFACNCEEYNEPIMPSLGEHYLYADQLCDSDSTCSAPTPAPTTSFFPSSSPSLRPSSRPSSEPSARPSISPSRLPSSTPTTSAPSQKPSAKPSAKPSTQPSLSLSPTEPFVCPEETVNTTEGTVEGVDIYGQTFVQVVQLDLITSAITDRGRACVHGLICAAGVCPPFNFLFVIDISKSTEAGFDGMSGDPNMDGVANTILDAELTSVLNAIQALVDAPGINNDNTDIGIVTFSTEGYYLGHWGPADPNDPDVINPGIVSAIQGIREVLYTNFDDALDKAYVYFDQHAPDVHNRTNIMFFLSDGVPNRCGDGDGWGTAEYFCSNGGAGTFPGAKVYTSELAALDEYNVIRHSIGVSSASIVTAGEALDMIDNTEDPLTRVKVEQVTDTDALTALVLKNPVVSKVLDFELKVNGNTVTDYDETDIISSPIGYAFGLFEVTGLDPTNGFVNSISASVLIDVDGFTTTLDDQLELETSTEVLGTAP